MDKNKMPSQAYPSAPPAAFQPQGHQGYPAAYHPTHQYPPQGAYGLPQGQGFYPAPPPTYDEAVRQNQAQSKPMYPGAQAVPAQYYPAPAAGYVPQAQPRGLVHAPGLFNAGARFDDRNPPTIPPPPPGCAPNAAQLAAMQGHTVVATKKKGSFFMDGAGGGSTFW